jgi:predicted metallopeptidase
MGIEYTRAPDIEVRVRYLARRLGMVHIDGRVLCVRSHRSRSRWTLARCHAMSKVFSIAMDSPMHYVIEVVAETYEPLSEEEKTKTLIHEMLHIPKAFGGGLRGHRYVTERRVNQLYAELTRAEYLEQRMERFLG